MYTCTPGTHAQERVYYRLGVHILCGKYMYENTSVPLYGYGVYGVYGTQGHGSEGCTGARGHRVHLWVGSGCVPMDSIRGRSTRGSGVALRILCMDDTVGIATADGVSLFFVNRMCMSCTHQLTPLGVGGPTHDPNPAKLYSI